jgi:hypothetical protein
MPNPAPIVPSIANPAPMSFAAAASICSSQPPVSVITSFLFSHQMDNLFKCDLSIN